MSSHQATRLLAIAGGLALPAAAYAFCGTYVGGVDADIYSNLSQVALVRDGNSTTLSLANDIDGDFDDFALVIPVPQILAEDDLHVLDPELFDRLDLYSQPRMVRYDCDDFEEADTDTDTDSDSDADADTDVDVEAEYIVGEYDVVILSSDQSIALVDWLQDNGYHVPDASAELLGDYIEGGSYFLAAKVTADAGIEPGDRLSPLQMRYESDVLSLPVKLGTLNSPGEQDLLIYGITAYAQGQLAISNWPQLEVEDECMLDVPPGDIGVAYSNLFDAAFADTDGATWLMEYGWGGGGCDPCTGDPPNPVDLVSLGVDEDWLHYGEYYFTRLHARYTPAAAEQDLSLYASGLTYQEQVRYIAYETFLEDRFPICTTGWADDPGSCDDEGSDAGGVDTGSDDDDDDDDDAKGCSSAGAVAQGGLWLLLIGLPLGLARTRRG